MKRTLLSLLFLIWLFAIDAQAATRWVVPSGGLGSGDCSTTGTACTIARAQAVAVAGDEVVFRDGVYPNITQINVTTGGSSTTNRITYRAENRLQARLEGSDAAGMIPMFRVRRSYVTVRGFILDGNDLTKQCFQVSDNQGTFIIGVIIEDNWCINQGGGGLSAARGSDLTIRYNYFSRFGFNPTNPGNCCSEVIYLGSAGGDPVFDITNVQVYGNVTENTISQIADIKATVYALDWHHNIHFDHRDPTAAQLDNDATVAVFTNKKGSPTLLNRFRRNIVRDMPTDLTGRLFDSDDGGFWHVEDNVIKNVSAINKLFQVTDGSLTNPSRFTGNTHCNSNSTTTAVPSGSLVLENNLLNQASGVCDAEITEILSEIAARPTIGTAQIGAAGADKIDFVWVNDKFPPLVSVDNAKISCTVAGVGRAVTSSVLVNQNTTRHTLASPVTSGQAVVCTGTLGLVVNSGRVGHTTISDLADSAAFTTGSGGVPSITNNVGGGGGDPPQGGSFTTHRQSTAFGNGPSSTFTFNHTVASGEDVLIVGAFADGSPGGATATFNGDPMTVDVERDSSGRPNVIIFKLATPDVGTFPVIVDWGDSKEGGAFAKSYDGDTTQMTQSAASQETTSNPGSVSMNLTCPVEAEALAILGTGSGDAPTITQGTSITSQVDGRGYAAAWASGAGTNTLSFTYTGVNVGSAMAVTCVRADGAVAPTYELTQFSYRFYELYNDASGNPVPLAAENTPIEAAPQAKYRVRIKTKAKVANPPPFNVRLRSSKTEGPMVELPAAFTNGIRAYGTSNSDPRIPTHGTATTEIMASTEATNVACAIIRDAVAIPNLDLVQDSETECEWIVEHDATVVPNVDFFRFQMFDDQGNPIHNVTGTPIVLPEVRIRDYMMGGF